MKLFLNRISVKKLTTISTVLMLLSIFIGFIGIPKLMSFALRKALQLVPGNPLRDMWTIPPFAVTFKVYIFNVTNPDDVMNGGRPRVKEIGPYMFDEYKTKFDLVDDEEADTVEYDMKNTFVFRPDLTEGLTGNEVVTIPHLLIMAGMIAVQRDKAPMLGLVSEAFDIIFAPKTPFLTAPVMDILFNGIEINCNHDEFAAQAFCTALKSEAKAVKVVNETLLRFSVLGSANDTTMGRFKAYRGKKNIRDLGRLVSFNDEPSIDVWDDEKCDAIKGTDSTIFPPFNKEKDGILAFAPDLCQSLGTRYVGRSKYNGISTSLLSITLGDARKNPDMHCYCRDPSAEDGCPPKGTIDLFKCTGAPLLGSKPHFWDTDPRLGRNIDGLTPNEFDHEIFLHFEPMTGSPLSAAKRLQFSLDMEPVPSYEILSKLPKTPLPLFWVEESAHLNKTFTNPLRYGLFLVLSINGVFKWTLMAIGVIGLLSATYTYLMETMSKEVKPIATNTVAAEKEKEASASNGNASGAVNEVESPPPKPNQQRLRQEMFAHGKSESGGNSLHI